MVITSIARRRLLQQAAAASGALLTRVGVEGADDGLRIAGQPVELQIGAVSAHTIRITALAPSVADTQLTARNG